MEILILTILTLTLITIPYAILTAIRTRNILSFTTSTLAFLLSVFGIFRLLQPVLTNTQKEITLTGADEKTLTTIFVLVLMFNFYTCIDLFLTRQRIRRLEAITAKKHTVPGMPDLQEVKTRKRKERFLQEAVTFFGEDPLPYDFPDILLNKDEHLYATTSVTVRKVERMNTPLHWVGWHAGFTIPFFNMDRGMIRSHVGENAGQLIPGTRALRATGLGPLYVTNQRVIFLGGQSTVEIPLEKLSEFTVTDNSLFTFTATDPALTVMFLVEMEAETMEFRTRLAIATVNGTRAELIETLKEEAKVKE